MKKDILSPTRFTFVVFDESNPAALCQYFAMHLEGGKRPRTIMAFLSGDEGRMRTLVRSVSNHSEAEVFDLDAAARGNGTVM